MDALERVREGKREWMPLLLLADPCEEMIGRYLDKGELFLLREGGEPACVAVVVRVSDAICEVKNLATVERLQGCGYGSRMLQLLFAHYGQRYDTMLVGTSELGIAFYRRLCFRYSHTVRDFFTDRYPAPIYEGGRQCVHMYYLYRPLGTREAI